MLSTASAGISLSPDHRYRVTTEEMGHLQHRMTVKAFTVGSKAEIG
jgi:hypothetical protein